MSQPASAIPRSIRINVPSHVLLALGERLAPVMHAFVDEVLVGLEGDRHRVAAAALQAYVGRFTALANMRIDDEQPVCEQLPSFVLGWKWGEQELARMQAGHPANEPTVFVPPGAAS